MALSAKEPTSDKPTKVGTKQNKGAQESISKNTGTLVSHDDHEDMDAKEEPKKNSGDESVTLSRPKKSSHSASATCPMFHDKPQ